MWQRAPPTTPNHHHVFIGFELLPYQLLIAFIDHLSTKKPPGLTSTVFLIQLTKFISEVYFSFFNPWLSEVDKKKPLMLSSLQMPSKTYGPDNKHQLPPLENCHHYPL
jgi:hypothetical protein